LSFDRFAAKARCAAIVSDGDLDADNSGACDFERRGSLIARDLLRSWRPVLMALLPNIAGLVGIRNGLVQPTQVRG